MSLSRPSIRRQRGLSLIELMIALTLGTFLILGLVQLFSASRQAFLASEGLSRVQETGRTAIEWMQRDLRMAGHLGCVSDQAVFLSNPPKFTNLLEVLASAGPPIVVAVPPPYLLDVSSGIQGFEAVGSGPADTLDLSGTENPPASTSVNDWNPPLPAALSDLVTVGAGQAVAGSDVVVVRYFSPETLPVQLLAPGAPSTITLPPGTRAANPDFRIRNGDVYGLNDCIQAATFQLSANSGDVLTVQASGLNLRAFDGTATFAQGTQLHRVETKVYYVGLTARGTPALYQMLPDISGAAVNSRREELLDGVETLQFQFGTDTAPAAALPDGVINAYTTAEPLNTDGSVITGMTFTQQWRRAGTARIGLLVRSPERAQSDGARDGAGALIPIDVNGTDVAPFDDQRVRQVYASTIAMRNRLFGN